MTLEIYKARQNFAFFLLLGHNQPNFISLKKKSSEILQKKKEIQMS